MNKEKLLQHLKMNFISHKMSVKEAKNKETKKYCEGARDYCEILIGLIERGNFD